MLCLLRLGVLLSSLWGGGVRRVIFIGFYLLRQTPPPHPLAGLPVQCGLRWLSIRHQARPQGHAKSHSLPLTLPGFFHGLLKSATAQEIPHGQFDWALASTNCRTAGHQLPQDGTNCFEEIHSTTIRILVLLLAQNDSAACPLFPARKIFVQLGSKYFYLLYFLPVCRLG